MAQVIHRRLTKTQALDLVRRMMKVNTPEHVIFDGLHQQGFKADEINAIINEVRSEQHLKTQTYATHINPQIMALGLMVITIVLLLISLILLVSSMQ